jgi:anthranilate synthase component 1
LITGFQIFGSSPEAQIIVKDRKAEIHPIAGTFKEQVMMKRRDTGQTIIRRQKKKIVYVMLVDLVCNDLQEWSHPVTWINIVQPMLFICFRVTGHLHEKPAPCKWSDTFPAEH